MIRHPPRYVPRLIATAQETMTQLGAFCPAPSDPLAIRARVITPIVFCASLVPCASETMDAEPSCPIRKPPVRVRSGTPRVSRYTRKVPTAAMPMAIGGDSSAGRMTFATRPCQWMAEVPAAASVAPTTPPISACDELDGMPRYQVARFQKMPPARPANTTVSVTPVEFTSPLAIVAATLNDRKAPTRLSTLDRATATFGGSAPVA